VYERNAEPQAKDIVVATSVGMLATPIHQNPVSLVELTENLRIDDGDPPTSTRVHALPHVTAIFFYV
jgi:hypothetical protein